MKNLILYPILLPTEDATPIIKDFNNKLIIVHPDVKKLRRGYNFQHLYLASDAPIKDGDWAIKDKSITSHGNYELQKITNRDLEVLNQSKLFRKILFTTDSKLIADGVPVIDGNIGCLIKPYENKSHYDTVNFLTEFCKRWNEKRKGFERDNLSDILLSVYIDKLSISDAKDKIEQMFNQKDNQKVDVEKLAKSSMSNGQVIWYSDNKEYYNKGFELGYNQALQSNTGGFSLEDMYNLSAFVTDFIAGKIRKIYCQYGQLY